MRLGRFRLTAIDAGRFRLDGGAMHGVVPKTLWSRLVSCDDHNRCEYSTTCLLIEDDAAAKKVLVETGNGEKFSPRERDLYGITQDSTIAGALRDHGVEPEAIDVVCMTHLHFDHAGGTTRRDGDGFAPVFARARHVIQSGEYEAALHPHERNRASYLRENFVPVEQAGLLHRVDGEADLIPGVSVILTPGHTPHHQSILVSADGGGIGPGEKVLFLGDVVPTSVHVPLPWIMAYDLEPVRTLETKRALWTRAVDEKWLVVFGHDTTCDAAYLRRDERGGFAVERKVRLSELA